MTLDSAIRTGFLLLAILPVCACEHWPESYAVPVQRPAFDDPDRWERVVRMTDVDAQEHFMSDIFDPLAGTWRWTGRRPMLRLHAPEQTRRSYFIDFAIPQQTLKSTGPVTLTFLVNGHILDRRTYKTAGENTFEKVVPSEWLTGGDTTLGAEIDKTYTQKSGGRSYGFLLISLGFRRN